MKEWVTRHWSKALPRPIMLWRSISIIIIINGLSFLFQSVGGISCGIDDKLMWVDKRWRQSCRIRISYLSSAIRNPFNFVSSPKILPSTNHLLWSLLETTNGQGSCVDAGKPSGLVCHITGPNYVEDLGGGWWDGAGTQVYEMKEKKWSCTSSFYISCSCFVHSHLSPLPAACSPTDNARRRAGWLLWQMKNVLEIR